MDRALRNGRWRDWPRDSRPGPRAAAQGARDIRVNQQQVNAAGERVGANRPDLQYTLNDERYYVEYDRLSSNRGPAHEARIRANDPNGEVRLETVD